MILKNVTDVWLGLNPLSVDPTKWSNTLKQFVGSLPVHCLSVFDYFVRVAFKGLKTFLITGTKFWMIWSYIPDLIICGPSITWTIKSCKSSNWYSQSNHAHSYMFIHSSSVFARSLYSFCSSGDKLSHFSFDFVSISSVGISGVSFVRISVSSFFKSVIAALISLS